MNLQSIIVTSLPPSGKSVAHDDIINTSPSLSALKAVQLYFSSALFFALKSTTLSMTFFVFSSIFSPHTVPNV